MKRRVFLYPGQGSQTVGMGVSLKESFGEAAAVFDCASDLAGYDMFELCSAGPAEKLSRTLYTQPALFTVEAAITDVLRTRGIEPEIVAGHSLGEFSAWYAAGVYSFVDGFRLVSERGCLMDSADPDGIGTMAAVIGLSPDVVEDVCSGIDGLVVVANYNSPLQQVISGEKEAVNASGAVLTEKGAKRVIPLKVSGAFHSPLMEKARESFTETVDSVDISNTFIPVFANVSASPVTEAEEIQRCMVDQLTSSVRWTETIQAILKRVTKWQSKIKAESRTLDTEENDIEIFEIGPGNVLAGLVKRIDNTLTVRSVSDSTGIMEVL